MWFVGLVVAALLVGRTRFSTDMSAFLPRHPGAGQQVLVDQLREGVVSRLVLVAVEGAPLPVLTAVSRDMATRLLADPQFASVANGQNVGPSRDRALLWNNRYLLSPTVTPERFSVPALHAALEGDLALLGSDLGILAKRVVPADPTGELLGLLGRFNGQGGPRSQDGVWVSADDTRALLMVQSVAAGFDIDAQEQGLAAIDAAFQAARQSTSASLDLHLVRTGPPVFAVMTRAQIKGDAERLSVVATLLVAVVLLVAYRSPLVLGLGLLPVASGALAGVAAVGATFGFVHGITLGFGVTLIGEAVDYAVYLFTQTPPGRPARDTLPRIWPILRLGMLTSVCGFSAMLFSRFDGFAQLGLFTIVGLLVALGVTRFVLPALRPVGFAGKGAECFAWPLHGLMRLRPSRRLALVVVAVMVSVVGLVMHRGPWWEDELSSMSPLPKEALARDAALRREIGAPDVRYMLVARAPDRQAALRASEQLVPRLNALMAQHAITGFDGPARWLPSHATQLLRQRALPDAQVLAANMAAAMQDTPFRSTTFAPFLADVEKSRHAALLVPEDLAGTGLGLKLDSMLVRGLGGAWTAVLPLQGVTDSKAVSASFASGDAVFLDLKAESDELLVTYRREALTLSVGGGLAIVLLLAVSLRRPARIAAVLLPLAAAVICTAAVLLLGDARLSIFNLFGLLLVVAIGSNYSLFFIQHGGAGDERHRMIASLALADLCTVIGFGVLSASGVPLLHGIGETVAIGACLSLVFAALLDRRRSA